MNRRKIMTVLSSLLAAPALLFARPAAALPSDRAIPITWVGGDTFAEVAASLAQLPDQCDGSPGRTCSVTGEQYIVIHESALARPGDEAVIEKVVAGRAARRISSAMDDRTGRIYWRERFEWTVHNLSPDALAFAKIEGPWSRVACYVRFTRARV